MQRFTIVADSTREKAMFRLALLLIVSLLSACSGVPHAFLLYYGNDNHVLEDMSTSSSPSVLVVDSRSLNEQQRTLLLQNAHVRGHTVLGYISIGELESPDRTRAENKVGSLETALLNWNEKFASWRVDVSDPKWQRWIDSELQRIANEGYSGFLLDTPDTVDNYITNERWNRTQRGEKVRAMVSLIREIKRKYPHHFVLLNRGLNLINAKIWMDEKGLDTEDGLGLMIPRNDNPDAILYENAFASTDPWTQRIESDLHATAKAGHTQIFALGYADTFGDRERYFTLAREAGFVAAWANSSTDLHEKPTQSP